MAAPAPDRWPGGDRVGGLEPAALIAAVIAVCYEVLLFDLFGTLVLFKPALGSPPGAEGRRPDMEWLREPVATVLPGVDFEEFRRALLEVSVEIIEARPPDYPEVESPRRFRRAIERVGAGGSGVGASAEALCGAHMAHLAAQTTMPEAHGELLRRLSRTYRLGLISNFDHGATARGILERDGILSLFETVLISAEVGRRKPHPAIFHDALGRLGIEADCALYVGDTVADDVVGAHAAGIDAAWINRKGADLPDDAPRPRWTIDALTDLEAALEWVQS